MVLTVILNDVDTELLASVMITSTLSVSHPVCDLEYADDTLLMSLTTLQIQTILSILSQWKNLELFRPSLVGLYIKV